MKKKPSNELITEVELASLLDYDSYYISSANIIDTKSCIDDVLSIINH